MRKGGGPWPWMRTARRPSCEAVAQDLISFEFEQESNTKLQKYSSATNDDRLVSSRLVSLSLSLTVCLSYLPVANDRTTRKNPSDTNTTLMIGT